MTAQSDFDSQLSQAKQKRQNLITMEQNRRQVFIQEKELEIDRLDEALSQFETTMNEELRQINEERETALAVIKGNANKTISREQQTGEALKGWYIL